MSDTPLPPSTSADDQQAQDSSERDTALTLAVIVHDIRTPLGAMSATADLLATTDLDARQARYVDTLRQAATALNDLASELLEETGEVSPRPKAPMVWNPLEFLGGLGALFSAKADGGTAGFVTDLAPDLDFIAEGDPNAVRRILSNLLDNALKFTRQGTVHLRAALTGEQAVIQVEDEGPGIAPEELARLFTPYTQGASGMGLQRGSGLGLWISRTLAERLGGSLDVKSTPGKGTCFTLTIPCPALRTTADDGSLTDVAAADETDQARQVPPGLNILVVDDNTINQLLITTFLDSFGMTFETATGGQDALRAVSGGAFDAVIMDLQMPEMDGIEATARLRDIEGGDTLPVIALTAGLRPSDTERLRRANFCAILGKPFTPDELLQAIRRATA